MEEAALWQDVLAHVEAQLGLPRGQMQVTVLVETLPAAFEMDEILHALRERIVGLNCGRWDYIFSYIKTLRAHGDRVLRERRSDESRVGNEWVRPCRSGWLRGH